MKTLKVEGVYPMAFESEEDVACRASSTATTRGACSPPSADLFHGCLLLQGVELQHHLGTFRRRREEASTPSFLCRR